MANREGICFGCGKAGAGKAARADLAISAARKLRQAFSLPEKRTVACAGCLTGLAERRKRFEKNFFWYRAGGLAFFAVVLVAAAAKNSLGAGAVFGAVAGAAIIACFSLLTYCPDFDGGT